ncbi:MAG: AAC(3) family N-acetyltransferase [Gemmatimonadaceae bacterium]|nr:AAC(3) family N-acetyltransferase [Gemmatimonadaceae bacterium]
MKLQTRSKIAQDLRSLGLERGDTVMVHASVRAIGEIAGGPDEIHLAIKDVITSEGCLFMYAGCPSYSDEVGRGHLSPEDEKEILEKLPVFDANSARSDRSNGALVEFLRTYPGSSVNQHVARFVAWGRRTEFLHSTQPWHYAYGRDSVLDRFVTLDGKILLLGSDHDNVTFLHYAEHIVDIPDKRVVRFQVPVEENGLRVWRAAEEFDTSRGAHANWSEHFFAEIVDGYLTASGNAGGTVGDARSYLFSARSLLEFALPVMASVASAPGEGRHTMNHPPLKL